MVLNPGGTPMSTDELFALHDPTLTWDDIAAFAEAAGMPLLLKGILRPEDARRAVEVGADAVIVSNHGGRQLDTVLSGADALPPIVEAVGDRIDVLVDGGLRRGWDVAKALALGADAVLVGRPLLWGLAREGQAGAESVLRQMLSELDSTLALLGCPNARDLDPSYVTPAPWDRPRSLTSSGGATLLLGLRDRLLDDPDHELRVVGDRHVSAVRQVHVAGLGQALAGRPGL